MVLHGLAVFLRSLTGYIVFSKFLKKNLLRKHFKILMNLNDEDHIKASIYLLEEYILINFVPA